jgi:hypothetical protein
MRRLGGGDTGYGAVSERGAGWCVTFRDRAKAGLPPLCGERRAATACRPRSSMPGRMHDPAMIGALPATDAANMALSALADRRMLEDLSITAPFHRLLSTLGHCKRLNDYGEWVEHNTPHERDRESSPHLWQCTAPGSHGCAEICQPRSKKHATHSRTQRPTDSSCARSRLTGISARRARQSRRGRTHTCPPPHAERSGTTCLYGGYSRSPHQT